MKNEHKSAWNRDGGDDGITAPSIRSTNMNLSLPSTTFISPTGVTEIASNESLGDGSNDNGERTPSFRRKSYRNDGGQDAANNLAGQIKALLDANGLKAGVDPEVIKGNLNSADKATYFNLHGQLAKMGFLYRDNNDDGIAESSAGGISPTSGAEQFLEKIEDLFNDNGKSMQKFRNDRGNETTPWVMPNYFPMAAGLGGLATGILAGYILDKNFGWGWKGYAVCGVIGLVLPPATIRVYRSFGPKPVERTPQQAMQEDAAQAQKIIDQMIAIASPYANKGGATMSDADKQKIATLMTQLTNIGYTWDKTTGKAKLIPGSVGDLSMLVSPE